MKIQLTLAISGRERRARIEAVEAQRRFEALGSDIEHKVALKCGIAIIYPYNFAYFDNTNMQLMEIAKALRGHEWQV